MCIFLAEFYTYTVGVINITTLVATNVGIFKILGRYLATFLYHELANKSRAQYPDELLPTLTCTKHIVPKKELSEQNHVRICGSARYVACDRWEKMPCIPENERSADFSNFQIVACC